MEYSFDCRSDRSGPVLWLKDHFTPEPIRKTGALGYAGAEFEFATCPAFCRGVERLVEKGVFGFTLVSEQYRNAVRWWMRAMRGYEIHPDWIVPTQGTIFSLATSIRLFTKPGEKIVTLPPNYNRYDQAARRLGRGVTPVPLKEENGQYTLDWEMLERAFSRPENKLLALCNPNNPTGHVYSEEALRRIAELSKRYDVAVFSDEIFGEIVFGGYRAIPYAEVAGKDALAITCTSMGKVFSLTGVNHANVIIENEALRSRYIEQRNADHFGCVDPMVYAGLLEAYSQEGRDWVLALREYLWENHRCLERFFSKYLPKAVVARPQGTYVAWVDYSAYGRCWEMLDRQIQEQGMFVGDCGEEYYGKSTCVRYSIAVPRAELERSLEQVRRALSAPQFQKILKEDMVG